MENLMHKNDLNSYCLRKNIPLPVYNTRFACTVSVGGKTFTSSSTSSNFTDRESAEQDAAKLALQHLLNDDASSPSTSSNLRLYLLRKLVCQDKTRCKMILNEFIDKTKMECAYETVQVEKSAHVFVSSLVLNGTCYKGEECGKNKKEAEKLAALSAILSLLDDPIYGTQISEVIKSKFSACDVFNVLKDCSVTTSNEFKATICNGSDVNVMPLTQQSSFRVVVDDQKPATSVEQVLVHSLPQTEMQGGHGVLLDDTQCVAGHFPGAVTISRRSYVPLPSTSPLVSGPQHEIKFPEATQLRSNQIGVPTELVLVPAGAAHGPGNDSSSSSKRQRNKKKKANKRLPRTPPLTSEPQHESKLLQQIGVPTELVLVPAAAHNPGNDPISSKKRRGKNKQKANKRRRVENK